MGQPQVDPLLMGLYDKKLLQYSLASYEYVEREARIDAGNALHRSFMVRKILRIDFTYFMLGLMFFWPQGKSVLVEKRRRKEGNRDFFTAAPRKNHFYICKLESPAFLAKLVICTSHVKIIF